MAAPLDFLTRLVNTCLMFAFLNSLSRKSRLLRARLKREWLRARRGRRCRWFLPREGGRTRAKPARAGISGPAGAILVPQVPFRPRRCHSGPAVAIPDPTGGNRRPAPLPHLHRAHAPRALPAEMLRIQQSRRCTCNFLCTSCRLSGLRKFPDPDIILCSMPEI